MQFFSLMFVRIPGNIKKNRGNFKKNNCSKNKMGDLEELIFTRNIPGKYSRWAEEQDDFNANDEEVYLEEGDAEDNITESQR